MLLVWVMNTFLVRGTVERFPGKNGWVHLKFSQRVSNAVKPQVQAVWPALLKARCRVRSTEWLGTIMPIHDGPLFVTFPAKVRKAEKIEPGQRVEVSIKI